MITVSYLYSVFINSFCNAEFSRVLPRFKSTRNWVVYHFVAITFHVMGPPHAECEGYNPN
jgi:hypothetical protein